LHPCSSKCFCWMACMIFSRSNAAPCCGGGGDTCVHLRLGPPISSTPGARGGTGGHVDLGRAGANKRCC
jgi:hypothetical protein